MKPICLVDPAGHSKAIFNGPLVTSEDLLRAALDLAPADRLTVRRIGHSEVSLAVLRSEAVDEPMLLGPKVLDADGSEPTAFQASLAQSAWLGMVNAGWTVKIAAAAAEGPMHAGKRLAGLWQGLRTTHRHAAPAESAFHAGQ